MAREGNEKKLNQFLDALPSDNNPFAPSTQTAQLISVAQNLVQAVNKLNQTLEAVLPYTQSTSTSATAGAATLPANPVGFLNLTNPVSGATIKVPYYS